MSGVPASRFFMVRVELTRESTLKLRRWEAQGTACHMECQWMPQTSANPVLCLEFSSPSLNSFQ